MILNYLQQILLLSYVSQPHVFERKRGSAFLLFVDKLVNTSNFYFHAYLGPKQSPKTFESCRSHYFSDEKSIIPSI